MKLPLIAGALAAALLVGCAAQAAPVPATPRQPCAAAIEVAREKVVKNYGPQEVQWAEPRLERDGYCVIRASVQLPGAAPDTYQHLAWRIHSVTGQRGQHPDDRE